MTDMQWRKLNGDTGTYTGPLVNLGHGIPRQMGTHGFRRAVYDIAFGYVSGFPVRDIIPFALRSLFPQRTLEAEVAYAEVRQPKDSVDRCPEWNCPDLSSEDRREGKTCPDHPCTCSSEPESE